MKLDQFELVIRLSKPFSDALDDFEVRRNGYYLRRLNEIYAVAVATGTKFSRDDWMLRRRFLMDGDLTLERHWSVHGNPFTWLELDFENQVEVLGYDHWYLEADVLYVYFRRGFLKESQYIRYTNMYWPCRYEIQVEVIGGKMYERFFRKEG